MVWWLFGTTSLLNFFRKFIYVERERAQGRGRMRGRERIPSRLRPVGPEPNVGLEPTNREILT